jgi:hypothetical protein
MVATGEGRSPFSTFYIAGLGRCAAKSVRLRRNVVRGIEFNPLRVSLAMGDIPISAESSAKGALNGITAF